MVLALLTKLALILFLKFSIVLPNALLLANFNKVFFKTFPFLSVLKSMYFFNQSDCLNFTIL